MHLLRRNKHAWTPHMSVSRPPSTLVDSTIPAGALSLQVEHEVIPLLLALALPRSWLSKSMRTSISWPVRDLCDVRCDSEAPIRPFVLHGLQNAHIVVSTPRTRKARRNHRALPEPSSTLPRTGSTGSGRRSHAHTSSAEWVG